MYTAAKGGRHTRELDKALPGSHTKMLYDRLPRSKSLVLAQMRTGKCKLKAYLYGIGAEELEMCECGEKETVKHVLLDCRVWKAERQELRTSVKDKSRWGDMSHLLGGWSGRKDPKGKFVDGEPTAWRPDLAAVKATIEFAIKTGRSTPRERCRHRGK